MTTAVPGIKYKYRRHRHRHCLCWIYVEEDQEARYDIIELERSQTATQGVINPARGALWLKLIFNPASSKPVFTASRTPPAPHNDITSPSTRSTSITTQPCRVQTRGRCGCATIARPGRPSLGCAVVGYYYCCCCCVLFLFCRHTHPCSRLWLCVSPPARPCFTHHVCVSCFRYSRAQSRPSGRWQPRVKGCRTAARVKFCEGARTCVRTR